MWRAFMALEKAYDTVERKVLWRLLSVYGVGDGLLAVIKAFYKKSEACVRVEGKE